MATFSLSPAFATTAVIRCPTIGLPEVIFNAAVEFHRVGSDRILVGDEEAVGVGAFSISIDKLAC
jgi:hypothetical protein